MEEKTKITTKTYYVCGKCSKKLSKISFGSGGSFDFDSFLGGSSEKGAMYCENKECEKFGDLTVVGVKKEE